MRKNLLIAIFIAFIVFISNVNFSFGVYLTPIQRAKDVKNQVEKRVREETEEVYQIQQEIEKEVKEGAPTTLIATPPVVTENQQKVKEFIRKQFKNMGENHRSRVANMVQNLLRNSERWEKENPGIGKEVREIAREQQRIMERNEASLKKIEKRNRFIKFLIGANYREIKKTRLEIENYKKEIEKLEKIKESLNNEEDKKIIDEQINALNQEIQKMEDFLNNEEKRFSLFGWLFKRIFK